MNILLEPGKAEDVTAVNTNETDQINIRMSWAQPSQFNGPFVGYEVEVSFFFLQRALLTLASLTICLN